MASHRLSSSTRNSRWRRGAKLLSALAGVFALVGAIAVTGSPAWAAGEVSIGTIEGQIANQAGDGTSGTNYLRYFPNSTGGNFYSGPTDWVTNPTEAIGSHGANVGNSYDSITQSASAVGIIPSTVTEAIPGTSFLIAQALHHNNTVYSGGADYTGDLLIELPALTTTFTVPWELWETPNGDDPCADGGKNGKGINKKGCADQIIFNSQMSPETVELDDGLKYKLVFDGFSPSNGADCPAAKPADTQNMFWTAEEKTTEACVYASLAQVRDLTIKKEISPQVDNAPDFPFTSDSSLDGSPWAAGSFDLAAGATKAGELLQGETVTVDEDLPTGWAFENLQCTYNNGEALSTEDADAISYSGSKLTIDNTPAVASADQSSILCTYTNSPPHTTVLLTKDWQNATDGHAVDLTVQSVDDNTSTVTSTAPLAPSDPAQISVMPNDTVNVSETFTNGNPANYTSTLLCTDGVTPDDDGNFTVPDDALGEMITCTFTNEAVPASVVVNKVWVIDGTTYANDDQPTDFSADLQLTGRDNPDWGAEYTGYKPGDQVTINEDASYPESCTYDESSGTGEYALDAGLNTITVTNTFSCPVSVELTKAWVHGITDDAVSLTITGDSVTGATGGSSIVPGTDTDDATATATRGSEITLTEGFTTGNASQYDTTLTCDDTTIEPDDLTGTFTIPEDAALDSTVSCEFTNSAKSSTLTLGKMWDNGKTGDAVGLTVTNTTTDVSDDSGTSTAPDAGSTSSVTVYPGDEVTIAEDFTKGSATNYTSTAVCGDETVVTLTDGSGSFTVPTTTAAGTTIDCTITNTRNEVSVSLQKQWLGAAQGDKANISINNATDGSGVTTSIADGTADFTDTTKTATATVFAGDTVNLAEALHTTNTGSYDVTAFSCDAADTDWTAGSSTSFTAPSSGPVVCTVTNERADVTVNLQKSWVNGSAGDTADLSINDATEGDDGFETSIVDEDPVVATTTVPSGSTVNLEEMLEGNDGSYTVSDLSCTNVDVTWANGAKTGSFTAPESGTVTCTFTNTRDAVTVNLQKEWVNGFNGDEAELTVSGSSNSDTNTSSSDGTAGTSIDTTNVASISALSGDEVTMSELMGTDNTGAYDVTGLSCTTGDVSWDDGAKTGTVTAPESETVTCTFTNERTSTELTLQKAWSGADTGDTAELFVDNTDGQQSDSGSDTATVPATGTGDAPETVTVDVFSGDTLTLGETLPDGNTGSYTSSIVCAPDAGFTADDGGATGTLVVPTSDLADGTTCTVSNSRSAVSVTLQKNWVDGADGDSAGLSINSGDPVQADVPDNGDGVSDGEATASVPSGSTVNLAEVFPFTDKTNTGSYDVTDLTCVDGNDDVDVTWNVGDPNGSFTAPASGDVTCTFSNTRTFSELTLQKTWVDGFEGDTTGLTAGSATGSSSSDGEEGSWTDIDNAVVTTVSSGQQIDLSEVLGENNAGDYTPTLTCDVDGLGDTNETTNGISGTFTMPATAADVTCEVTNTRDAVTLTLQKQWADGAKGDTADLSLTSGGLSGPGSVDSEVATDLFSGIQAGDSSTVTVYPGDTLTLSETLGSDNTGAYKTTLTCGTQDMALDSELSKTFPAPEVDTTCTYLNERNSADVTLQKVWVNGPDPATVKQCDAQHTTGSSTSGGQSGSWTDSDNTVTTPVFSGQEIDLSEVLGSGNDGSYTPTLTFDADGLGDIEVTDDGISGTYTMPTAAGDVTCEVTNTRTSADMTLQKVWVNGAEGDTTALAAGDEDGSSTSNGDEGSWTDSDNTVTTPVFSGQQIDLSEVLDEDNTGSYTPALTCSVDGLAITSLGPDGISGLYTMPSAAADVTCDVTNTRTSAEITLQKEWANGAVADTADLSLTNDGLSGTGDVHSEVATDLFSGIQEGDSDTVTVYSGETLTLAETLGGDNTGTYTTTLLCGENAVDLDAELSASFLAPTVDTTCTYLNERTSADLTLQKTWVNGAEDDTTALTAGAEAGSSTSGGEADSWTDSDNAVVTEVFSGQQINVSEALGSGNTGTYEPTLTCDVDGLGDTEVTEDGISGTYTMPSEAADVTCEVTNERTSATITLEKEWADGAKGDSANLSLTSDGLSGPGTVNSAVATDLFSGVQEGDSDAVVVYSGDELTLAETLGAGNTGEYSTTLTCGKRVMVLDGALSATLDAPAMDTTCTFVNTQEITPPLPPSMPSTGVNMAGIGWLVLLLLGAGALLVTAGTVVRRKRRSN